MSPSGPSRPHAGTASLVSLAILGLIGLADRKAAPTLAVSQPGGSENRTRAGGAGQGGRSMPSGSDASGARQHGDSAPGESKTGGTDVASGVRAYLIGFGLAALLTAGSFGLSYTHLIYGPAIPIALIVFAVAQIGIHLVFFLHLTTSPDNINNALALAFGVLILLVLISGTLWIMGHMNANMMPGAAAPQGGMMNMAP